MRYKRTGEPTALPVHLDDAKKQLAVEHTDDDAQIAAYIRAAVRYVETFTRRCLAASTYQMQLDSFWTGALDLPFPPLRGISSIVYKDTAGDTQTLATSYYDVDRSGLFGRVYAAYGQSFPSVRSHPDAVTITWQAGYGCPFTAATTGILTLSGWTPVDGEGITLMKTGGEDAALPAGLSEDTTYYVRDVVGSTCKLAATATGDAIVITDTGTGTHWFGVVPSTSRSAILLLVAHWYEHHMAVEDARMAPLPMGVESLLWAERVEL